MLLLSLLTLSLTTLKGFVEAAAIEKRASLDACPGYTATNVQQNPQGVTADLSLGGPACNVYGQDLTNLKLLVEYQTGMKIILLLGNRPASIDEMQILDSTSRSTMPANKSIKYQRVSCHVQPLQRIPPAKALPS